MAKVAIFAILAYCVVKMNSIFDD